MKLISFITVSIFPEKGILLNNEKKREHIVFCISMFYIKNVGSLIHYKKSKDIFVVVVFLNAWDLATNLRCVDSGMRCGPDLSKLCYKYGHKDSRAGSYNAALRCFLFAARGAKPSE